jgi:hypothetical protein
MKIWIVLALGGSLLVGCAATREQCMRDQELCVRRCQNTGVPDKSKEWNLRPVSETTCERQCGCGEHKAQPSPSSGPPTLTGN